MKKYKQRWVIKAGSSLIASSKRGLDDSFISSLVKVVKELKDRDIEIVVVSSGAVAQGMYDLDLNTRPESLPLLQASAAVGQLGLINLYQNEFKKFSIQSAQVLISHSDIANRGRYLNARHSLNTLLSLNVVPIVNENDSVATDEISFGDNDSLAGAIAGLINASKLIILTDQEGVYTSDPNKDTSAKLIKEINLDEESFSLSQINLEGSGVLGRGGMITKIEAAKKASTTGCVTWILKGDKIDEILDSEFKLSGTKITSNKNSLQSRKQWIVSRGKPSGSLIIDTGAVEALKNKGTSLLPVGIISCSGKFEKGDLISCFDNKENEIALGLTNLSSQELKEVIGLKSEDLSSKLGYLVEEEVIHRDNLVLS